MLCAIRTAPPEFNQEFYETICRVIVKNGGDDINDMSIIEIVGFSACPSDASTPVKQKVSLILKTKGGYGCVREFSDLYLAQNR